MKKSTRGSSSVFGFGRESPWIVDCRLSHRCPRIDVFQVLLYEHQRRSSSELERLTFSYEYLSVAFSLTRPVRPLTMHST